jgi:hypothetical protein
MDLTRRNSGLWHLRITPDTMIRDGERIAEVCGNDPGELYRALGCSYAKFFKMDVLCKWAWLGAEALLRTDEDGWLYEGLDKSRVAVVLHTTDGCLAADKRYAETLQTIPSPALFVYTLPNIMLGEICIRHGFTGEQLCQVTGGFDAEDLLNEVKDILLGGAMHCLFGKIDALDDFHDVCLFWVDAERIRSVEAHHLQAIYDQAGSKA